MTNQHSFILPAMLLVYFIQLKRLSKLFPNDLWLILLYVETITPWRFHIRPYAKRKVNRYILNFVLIVTKTTLSSYQHYLNPFYDKIAVKSVELSQK